MPAEVMELHDLDVADEPLPGVNLVGYLDAEFGLGEAARMLGRALEHGGVPIAAITNTETPVRREHELRWPLSRSVPYDINVLCLQPDQVAGFATQVGPSFFENRSTIGLWFWDSSVLDARYHQAFRFLDRVWVMTEHVREVVSAATDMPVHLIPIAPQERTPPGTSREELGLPAEFLFMALFDFVSFERKNPLGMIDAFVRAFEPSQDAALFLKSINGRERKPKLLAQLQSVVADRDDITLVDGYVGAAKRDALLATCDCFVSLHRAEGLGLPMLEAITLARPVIATGYLGNMQFMDGESSYLVPFELVPIPEGEWGFSAGAKWAEPDVAAAASHMRRVYEKRDEARARAIGARRRLFSEFSLDKAARVLTDELEDARRTRMLTGDEVQRQKRLAVEAARAERAHARWGSIRGARGIIGRLHERLTRH